VLGINGGEILVQVAREFEDQSTQRDDLPLFAYVGPDPNVSSLNQGNFFTVFVAGKLFLMEVKQALRPPASTKPMTLTIPIHSTTGVPADNVGIIHPTRKVTASMRATAVENHAMQTPGETPFRPVGCLPLPLNTA